MFLQLYMQLYMAAKVGYRDDEAAGKMSSNKNYGDAIHGLFKFSDTRMRYFV
jgi:hypothetical protein